MLRITPRHAASPAFTPPVLGPARPAIPSPVFTAPRDTTVAARGHLHNGCAAALILDPAGLSVVSADRCGRRRVRRFTIREILAVEEHRMPRGTELVIVIATTAISIGDVDTAQAWTLCREVRQLIRHGRG